MNKEKWFKVGGIVGIILGCVSLYFGGGTADNAVAITGGAFSLIGIIALILGGKK